MMWIPSPLRARLPRLSAAALAMILGLGTVTLAQQGSAPDRSRPPAPGPVPAFRLPVIQKGTLSNGLPVWLVEMHGTPLINVTVVIKAGGADDPAGRYGLADFTASMLDEGAGSRDALALSDAIDFLGASLSASSTFDASTVSLQTLTSKVDAALPLLADVVLRPTFEARELERVRTERLTTLIQLRDDAAQLAPIVFARELYGPTHRYGTLLMGGEAANRAIGVADLRRFHAERYQPQNALVIVTGDTTLGAMQPRLEQALGGWTSGPAVARPALSVPPVPASRRVVLVDKPGAAQSQVRIGSIGVARSTPDFFALDVMNTMLGGSFTSRLNQNLREVHGYTYGAFSGFTMRLAPGPFAARAGVQTDKTLESLTEFFKELEAIRTPAPPDEVARARNLQALSFPSDFETARGMAAQVADLAIYSLPESFFNDYVPRIQAVGPADVQRVARQYVVPDRSLIVVAGDLSKIEASIRSAGWGPVSKVDGAALMK